MSSTSNGEIHRIIQSFVDAYLERCVYPHLVTAGRIAGMDATAVNKVWHESRNTHAFMVRSTARVFARELIRTLYDYDRWSQLARKPSDFNRELNRELSLIRTFMKAYYQIEQHRPTKNSDRDLAIWMLKHRNPNLGFGVIGRQFKISPQAARNAWERQQRREKVNPIGRFLFSLPQVPFSDEHL